MWLWILGFPALVVLITAGPYVIGDWIELRSVRAHWDKKLAQREEVDQLIDSHQRYLEACKIVGIEPID